jgi:hypothetical protein
MFSTAAPTPTYPVAYFLHSPHAAPKTLQSALATPSLFKLRKAWLPGYLPAPNSTVSASSSRMGDWQDEDEIQGVVHYVPDAEQERRVKEHVGVDCEVKEVDFGMCVGGVFGVREWVSGRAFVVWEEEEIGREEDEMRVQDTVDAAQPGSASKKEKGKALLRRITEPLGIRTASSVPAPDEQAAVRRAPGRFRRITSGISLPVGKHETGESSSTAQATEEPVCQQDAVVRDAVVRDTVVRDTVMRDTVVQKGWPARRFRPLRSQ